MRPGIASRRPVTFLGGLSPVDVLRSNARYISFFAGSKARLARGRVSKVSIWPGAHMVNVPVSIM